MLMKITQGDKYTIVRATLTKNGVAKDISGAIVRFYFTNIVSGNVYWVPCTVSGNVISFQFTSLTDAEAGVYKANYYIYFSNGDAISVPNQNYIDLVIKPAISTGGASILLPA
jgi:hypothetical protein